ncbi:hypothetical protein RHGRI_002914 [Rhododendron griersonianum]|uniref:MPBQ/MBSQ family SAM-binding methyltransferase profile domain-containing protein n=1 Tax=Rhododendron griersonianum TaxID=479676 RepID=A0AAV6LS39_9ERIC|nr:hypothetical protein RHGRI_002914 [Rhododendron griersonianum]
MASSMLIGADNLTLLKGSSPNQLRFIRPQYSHRTHFPQIITQTRAATRTKTLVPKCSISAARPVSQPRFIQHKKEAFWFYRFLSIAYDHVINPGHWTEDMRDDALKPADLSDRGLVVVDVGGGTGFTTLGIVKDVDAKNVTILDQSPHQLAKAKEKEPLTDCRIIEGDAEDLPFDTDYADRYSLYFSLSNSLRINLTSIIFMASSMPIQAQNLTLIKGIAPNRLGFVRSELRGNQVSVLRARTKTLAPKCSLSAARPVSQPRFIQHKKEAFWFYRFLSIVYDHVINPGHWTEDMRDDALEPADLSDRGLVVVDVGGGTGFTTLGIVEHVDAKNVTILDQSPHQLAKAKEKEPLKECKIIEGDAEDLPFDTGYADRYVSAGSIEYWPDPQRGIREAYRVLKLGGKACLIGPVYPTFWLSRFFADAWMLFPKEEEYIEWFQKAGFKDVQLKRIGPKWYRGVRRHGLIMGCSVTGVKPASGDSPLQLGPKAEDVSAPVNPLVFLLRFLLGATAGMYYVLVPIYMWLKDQFVPKGQPI